MNIHQMGYYANRVSIMEQDRAFCAAVVAAYPELEREPVSVPEPEPMTEPVPETEPARRWSLTNIKVRAALYVKGKPALHVMPPCPSHPRTITGRRILAAITEASGYKRDHVIAPDKHTDVLLWRQAGMYFARKKASLSSRRIGSIFGGRDHSTVLNSIRRVESHYPLFKSRIMDIESLINDPDFRGGVL